ncbi:Histidine kinase-, DNA gyrase B-, and HSP90-like ATPase [Desulfomicrobium norvegicum]|uniref:Histidine kinase-, DNA gyrase B-, and HSP90-like ATPase n=1 Tax=Desulfomicrobium norvegicum (strain DSM 1741 / NCIMB 8310) TaxID=52561 RepID=A0A8G2F4M0_DESNO|nr:sensor histidine kinase [Desulfomicrobium norvegicum]SFL30817.1 Histidine kinase-, DNA gyrase B-, and HSP90-like ATPase [Desulfomicrobium norvegicum]
MTIHPDTTDSFPASSEEWRMFVAQSRKTHHDLLERIKELNCLYGISRLAQNREQPLGELLTGIADLIRTSWQYPDIACASIRLGDTCHNSGNFVRTRWCQSSPIIIEADECGTVEVCYLEERPGSDEGPFLREERSLIDAVADQIGRIVAQRRAEEQMRALSQELIMAQENERQRIARELHDHLAQDLSLARADLERIGCGLPEGGPWRAQTGVIAERIGTAIRSIRDLAYGLLPPGLTELGLVETVLAHCEDFSLRHGIAVDVFADGLGGVAFDFDTQINIYRLIQEALNNVRKHAKASRVTIRLLGSYPNLLVRIEDDGCGADMDRCLSQAGRTKRMGLWSMRERVKLLGGKISFRSKPGQGLHIRIETPLNRSSNEHA